MAADYEEPHPTERRFDYEMKHLLTITAITFSACLLSACKPKRSASQEYKIMSTNMARSYFEIGAISTIMAIVRNPGLQFRSQDEILEKAREVWLNHSTNECFIQR